MSNNSNDSSNDTNNTRISIDSSTSKQTNSLITNSEVFKMFNTKEENASFEDYQLIIDCIYKITDQTYKKYLDKISIFKTQSYKLFIFDAITHASQVRPYYTYLYADLWIALHGTTKFGSKQSFLAELLRRKKYVSKITGNVIKNTYKDYTLEQLMHGNEDDSELAKVMMNDDLDKVLEKIQGNFDEKVNKLNLLDASCHYGALRCFKYFMNKEMKITESTLNLLISGGNFEIYEIVKIKRNFSHDHISRSIKYHSNEIAKDLVAQHNAYDFVLYDCVRFQNLDLLKLFYKNSTKNARKDAFMQAAENNDIFAINLLLGEGCEIPEEIVSTQKMNLEIVHLLERNGLDFLKDDKGIIRGVFDGNQEVVEYLIDKGANVNARDDKGCSVLVRSCIFDFHFPIAKKLVEHGANIEEKDENGYTPLLKACSMNLVNTVEFLLSCGADAKQTTKDNETALMIATNKCGEELIDILIKNGLDLNDKDNKSNTAFFHAVKHHNKTVIERLIYHGAKIDEECENGMTPIMISVASIDLLKYFDEKKCDLNHSSFDGLTAVLYAAEHGFTDALRYLMERGANFFAHDNKGKNVIHYAAGNDNSTAIDYLLSIEKLKKLLNEGDVDGNTPIYYCEKEQVVRSLLRSGSDMEHRNSNNDTPLFYSVIEGKDLITKYLLKNGAKTQVRNNQGPLIAAAAFANIKSLVEQCLNDGAFYDDQTEKGNTALMYAAMNDDFQTVQLLGSKGADVKHKNKDGKSAIDFAESSSVIAYLEKRGATYAEENNGEQEMFKEDGYYCTEIEFE
ncbi:hypothetical protein TVAG_033370 [Trichomonas vaginalis G3]|uniref:DUF3447 domain-containing protein n=1 Tax=Trichomonas vaginalis (strain ATCC PRA-98 / G3) TaxID=412133 RepID=A2FJ02_TRIV3|nr:protein ubiquitination [Trichomonas vaginalis G3]EAX95117.1 hypothetical protein TVAG_033370 [Trichomonas vaginalis G3]KAI5524606.1 protein ubiquitination [Trichomonas vaginalis G3]|eukprot:XP_001308047.1 hypothetical protein [Trichomonas vaginalis G3]